MGKIFFDIGSWDLFEYVLLLLVFEIVLLNVSVYFWEEVFKVKIVLGLIEFIVDDYFFVD